MTKVFELFSGTASFSKVAEINGYECKTLDNDIRFNPTYCIDINDFTIDKLEGWKPDFIWASPPCQEYSHAKRRGIRDIDGANKNVQKALDIIKELNPKYWIIENPQTGLLKNQLFMRGLPYVDVSYCKYGMPYRKQTRFWNNITTWKPKPICMKDCKFMNGKKHISSVGNGRAKYTDKSFSVIEKYCIPKELCYEIIKAIE